MLRSFLESYMATQGITAQRIKEILDQDMPRFEETTRYVQEYSDKSKKILDISKGRGWEGTYGSYLRQEGYSVDFFGVGDVRFKWEILDNTYDTVLALEIFEHLNPLNGKNEYDKDLMKDARFFLTECKRVLKQGGILILTTPNITDYGHIESLIAGKEPYYLHHFREFAPGQVYWELYHADFNIVEINTIVNHSIPQIAQFIIKLGGKNEKRGKHIIAVARKG